MLPSFTFIFSFVSISISFLLYFLLSRYLPIPSITPKLPDLLPYYEPFISGQFNKLVAFVFGTIFILFCFTICFLLFSKFSKKLTAGKPLIIQVLNISAFIVSITGFIYLLYENLVYMKVYNSIFTLDPLLYSPGFLFSILMGIILLIYLLFKSPGTKKKTDVKMGKSRQLLLFFILASLIFFTLFDRTMDEKNLFVDWTRQYTHSAVFIQPIYDLLNGKAVLSDTDSMYGTFVGIVPAIIFKFIPLTFTHFFYLMIVFGIFYYLCAVVLLKIRLGSFSWTFIGLVMLFSLHFYPLLDRYIRPMVFPLRYLLDIPFFLLLLYQQKRNGQSGILLSLFLAFAVYYNSETGFALVASYFAYCILKVFDNPKTTLFTIIQMILSKLFIFISAFFFIGFLYSLYAKFTTGLFPDWTRMLYYVRIFSAGQTQDTPQSLYLLPLLIYLTTLIRTAFFIIRRKIQPFTAWDAGLAVYGLIILSNYVSRSYIINLIAVGIPAVILAIIHFKELYLFLYTRKKTFCELPLVACYLILGSFCVFSLAYYIFHLPQNSRVDYWRGDKTASAALFDKIDNSSQLIEKYIPIAQKVTLLSFFDTLLLLRSSKINSIPFGTSQNILTKSQSEEVAKSIIKDHPQFIFADSDTLLRNNIFRQAYIYLDQNYEKIDSRGILDVWKRIK